MKPKLLSLLSLPDEVKAMFEKRYEVEEATELSSPAVISIAKPDILLCSIDTNLDRTFLTSLPKSVKAVATYSVGSDHVDLEAARELGVSIFNTPGALADSVADAAMLLLLGAARRATESISLLRERRWSGWRPTQLLGYELAGKKLGLIGMGEIGRRISVRASAFGMSVAYTNRSGAIHEKYDHIADPCDLIAASDALVLACPSTPETRHIINRHTLSRASPSMILVNVSRGELIHDGDLISSLANGEIFAAGLDVFEGEPEVNPRYFELPNVFMLPHIGSSTVEARVKMGQTLIDGFEIFFAGKQPSNKIA